MIAVVLLVVGVLNLPLESLSCTCGSAFGGLLHGRMLVTTYEESKHLLEALNLLLAQWLRYRTTR